MDEKNEYTKPEVTDFGSLRDLTESHPPGLIVDLPKGTQVQPGQIPLSPNP